MKILNPSPPHRLLLSCRSHAKFCFRSGLKIFLCVFVLSSLIMGSQAPPSQQSKHDIKIAPGAIVCFESKLRGDITIGSKTVVHPKATIIAEAGPIVIGEGNVIEEQAVIINRISEGQDSGESPTLTIGTNNVFEVDCHFESMQMGNNNVLESKSYIGPGVEVTNGCTIGAGCKLTGTEVLPENVVIYGSECTRRIAIDKPQPQGLQVDYLSRVLPSYHHLKKGKKT